MSPPELHNHCLQCGYVLDGLTTGRCPECGREFDWNDPKTIDCAAQRENDAAQAFWTTAFATTHLLILSLCTSSVVLCVRGECAWEDQSPLYVCGLLLALSSPLVFRICASERGRAWRSCRRVAILDLLVATIWSIGSLRVLFLRYW